MTVEFVDELPASSRNYRGRWDGPRDAVRERPGEWAIVFRGDSRAHAGGIAQNFVRRRPGFQAVSRAVDGEHRVYARYVGENGEHA